MTSALATGLSDAEVAQRVAEGKTNDVPTRASRTVSEIVKANVFTRINAILVVLFRNLSTIDVDKLDGLKG